MIKTHLAAVFAALFFWSGTHAHAQVAPPAVSPAGGYSPTAFEAVITGSGQLRYTTDGSDPTATSAPVPAGGRVLVGKTLRLKARAWDAGGVASAVVSADFSVTGGLFGGGTHALALKSNGEVWAWGQQANGRLGNAVSTSANRSPLRVWKASNVNFNDATDAAAGYSHTLIADQAGNVWACGENAAGQLGNNTLTDQSLVVRVLKSANATDYLTGVAQLSAGKSFSLAVDLAGTAWSWGAQGSGRLGNGQTSGTQSVAQPVTAASLAPLTGIVKVSAGQAFGLALDNLGQVWSWGSNASGQLGIGSTVNQPRAGKVKVSAASGTDLSGVVDIACGNDHAVALRRSATEPGTVWCWGLQSNGRLGNNTTAAANIKYPVKVQRTAGTGGGDLTDIVQVAAGPAHSVALDSAGNVWAWGLNADGQLGYNSTTQRALAGKVKINSGGTLVDLSNIVFVAAGGTEEMVGSPAVLVSHAFTLAIAADGTVYSWGYNGSGELARTSTASTQLVAVAAASGVCLLNRAPVISSFTAQASSTIQPSTLTLTALPSDADGNLAQVQFYNAGAPVGQAVSAAPWSLTLPNMPAGTYSFTAVATDSFGESASAVASPAALSVALPTVTLSKTGSPLSETSATPAKFSFTLNKAQPSDLPIAYSLSGSSTATPGLDFQALSGSVTIPAGLLSADVNVTPLVDYLSESTESVTLSFPGTASYLAAVTGGTISISDVAPPAAPLFTPAAGGYAQAGSVLMESLAGSVIRYTLDGSDPGPGSPSVASGTLVRFPGSDTLNAQAVRDGVLLSAVARGAFESPSIVAAGANHSVAIDQWGQLWAWGTNDSGALGCGSLGLALQPNSGAQLWGATSVAGGLNFTLVRQVDGKVYGFGSNLDGQLGIGSYSSQSRAVAVGLPVPAQAVAAGLVHGAALSSAGAVYTWGSNTQGQLGTGNWTSSNTPVPVAITNVSKIACGHFHTLAIKDDGTLWGWGWNNYGQLGSAQSTNFLAPVRISTYSDFVAVAAGQYHTVALRANGTVWVCGYNAFGQLGLNSTTSSNVLGQVTSLSQVVAIGAGASHSMAVLKGGDVKAWGQNSSGQLGDGSTSNRLVPVVVPGLSGIASVAGGTSHSQAIGRDGRLWAWGGNTEGQVGNGTQTQQLSPAASPYWDQDGDGLTDAAEVLAGTDLHNWDTNSDGISDGAGGSPLNPDVDGDGLTNVQEYLLGTNPFYADSDGDGVPDGTDYYPLDPARQAAPSPNPADQTAPVITLTYPLQGVTPL